jgi:hypothetical protein
VNFALSYMNSISSCSGTKTRLYRDGGILGCVQSVDEIDVISFRYRLVLIPFTLVSTKNRGFGKYSLDFFTSDLAGA